MDSHDAFSGFPENLTHNQKLLSTRERELLACILRQAQKSASENPQVSQSVDAVLARAIGDVLLARAAEIAGRDLLQEIREQDWSSVRDTLRSRRISAGPPSPSPSPSPHPPAPSPAPGPHRNAGMAEISAGPPSPAPGSSPHPPASGPPPRPPAPGPGSLAKVYASGLSENTQRAVDERPDVLHAECVVLQEFLAAQELQELMCYALEHEADFRVSQVISPGVEGGVVNPEYRRSRVLMELGRHGELLYSRIRSALPHVLEKLAMDVFPITRVETQITASNDGDFFRHHSDNAEKEIERRQLTFVYFFHREPKAFDGGELRLHDSQRENGVWTSIGQYRCVVPEQNQMVFFRSELLHEITPVECPSQAFADSRFTVNGWLHR